MGIDITGGMIIGAKASDVSAAVWMEDDDCELYGTEGNYFEEFYEWYEEVDMRTYSYHYDASEDYQIVGFTVKDIEPLSDGFEEWVADVKAKAAKFKELTGIEPELIGMQHVW